ncbi:cytochrome P450 monooxygenase pc-3 [Rhizoctonia solani AG-1 IA]|uniref:Cytochrome P450 monooxygenase pc-3 n=1 Tax=Thanatephorus cucumeris (strain AG1-IA) TaxID=983506 RepID=L8WJH2_THACA|nr:cytochrome P450 monooxygenase pc-3 [Rhizoctonia solani AG-1 IA]
MPRTLKWGAGLSIVLHSIPSLVLPPGVAILAQNVLSRATLTGSSPWVLKEFLGLPAIIQTAILWMTFVFSRKVMKEYQRQADRKRLGPDVIEVPRVKLNWCVVLILRNQRFKGMRLDYCTAPWAKLSKKYGYTFNLRLFGEDQSSLSFVLTFGQGRYSEEKWIQFWGRVFLMPMVKCRDMWKFHRGMSRPYFSRDRISHFDNFARHSDLAISKILSRLNEPARPGQPIAVDFQDLVARFTLDSGTEFLFGADVRSLDSTLPYPHEKPKDNSASFAAAFGRAQESLTYRLALGHLWSWMELFWDRTKQDMDVIDAYITPLLRQKLDRKRISGLNRNSKAEFENISTDGMEEAEDTLLDHLVQFTDGKRSSCAYMHISEMKTDISVIKDELINILVAARDTVRINEVLGRLGTSNHPTPEDFKEMKYLRAVINETLRLFPAVPVNERTAVKSTVLNSGEKKYYVPAGATIFGPDADEFDPERWLDDRLKKYVTPNPFIFLPFNAGPRICLGQQFAYKWVETSYFLSRLLQRVESFELVPEAYPAGTLPPADWKNGEGRKVYEKIWPKSHLTIYCNRQVYWWRSSSTSASQGTAWREMHMYHLLVSTDDPNQFKKTHIIHLEKAYFLQKSRIHAAL